MSLTRLRRDDEGLIAAGKAGAGEQDRLQEVSLAANLADSCQVRTDLAAQVSDGVAGETGCLGAIEHRLSAANVAPLARREDVFQTPPLLRGIDIERRQQGFPFLLDRLGIFRQPRAKYVRADARSPLRLLERRKHRKSHRLVAAAIERR